MAWLARSIAATLSSPRGEPDPDADDDDPESEPASAGSGAGPGEEESSPRGRGPNRGPGVEAEEPEQPGTPSRGVKDDISELTETLTRRLWGVASFLAPPPEAPTPRAGAAAPAEGEEEEEDAGDGAADGEEEAAVLSPRIAGIRSDLAEFGGRVRSGFSMLQNNLAVAEISKIASSILPFGQGEADEGEAVPGVTEEVVVFVRHISTRPETWLDFPLFISERYADDFELSDAQYVHALSIEHLIPGLSDLKIQICSTDMTEACFWKIYFVLLHSKLNKQDAELLSTPQILEAREQLLQSLQAQNKRGSKFPDESSEDVNVSPASAEEKVIQPSSIQDKAGTSENVNASSAPTEEKVIHPSSIQDKAGTSDISSFEEPTSDIMPEIESEKFPISATEVEIVDKSVIEEALAVKDESKTPPVQSKLRFEADEDDVDEWPDDDDPAGEVGAASNRTSLGREEDVSFSDLEDDEDDDVNKRHGQYPSGHVSSKSGPGV